MATGTNKDIHFSFERAKPWNLYQHNFNSVVELGQALVNGTIKADNVQAPYPMGCLGPLEEIQPNLAFIPFFGNVTILSTCTNHNFLKIWKKSLKLTNE